MHDSAFASAKTDLSFTPQANMLVPISLEVTGRGHWYFSVGYVALYDFTAGAALWSFGWDGLTGTLPWVDHPETEPRGTAHRTLNTELLDSHEYTLTLYSWVSSQEPSSGHIVMEVGGIEVVPEPSGFALTVLAGMG